MEQEIEHTGIIQSISGSQMKVMILQQSACSGCHAKGACTSADVDDKIIDVDIEPGNSFKTGDWVTIYGRTSMGMFAVLIAFVVPFLLILLTLVVLGRFTTNEAISGTVSLAILLPYYFVLSLFKDKLKKRLKFKVR